MAELSLTAAAKAVGIARSTFNEHVASGKVSVQISGQGRRTVDTSELLRVYGALRGVPDSSAGHYRTVSDTDMSNRAAVLEAENRGLLAVMAEKDLRIEELRHTVRLLGHKPEPVAKPARPVIKSDRTPVIVAVSVLLLVVLALALQATGVIRLH